MYSDIFRNKKDNYVEYSQSITIEIKKNKNFKIFQESYKNRDFYVFGKYDFTDKYTDFVKNILRNLFSNKKIKIYTLLCGINHNDEPHSELIFFQIYENMLYIINYDPSGKEKNSCVTMRIFIDYLSKISEDFLEENNLSFSVKTVYKENLEFQYGNIKLGGLQRLTKNLYFLSKKDRPTGGICVLYSLFMIYFLINVIYNYNIPCYQAIINIESIMYNLFEKNNELFANIFINFSNHILNRYFEYSLFQIDNYMEKKNFQKQINIYFDMLFKEELSSKSFEKYIEQKERLLRSSGYSCNEDVVCESNNCLNNHCYIDEKGVDPEDIRSVGNPCLYNIQCRSGNCKDYVCIGEDNHEKQTFYDTGYDPDEILEYDIDAEILDNQNNDEYLNM